MTSFPEIDYQRQLIFASLDDFTPNDTLSDYRGGQFGFDKLAWMAAVITFLSVNVECGLIELTHKHELTRDPRGLADLLKNGDSEDGMESDVVWNALYFNSTPKLDEILDRLNLRSWEAIKTDLNYDFINELKRIYSGR